MRAARDSRILAIPATDAVVMAAIVRCLPAPLRSSTTQSLHYDAPLCAQAAPGSPYRPEHVDASLFAHLRSERLSALAVRILSAVRGSAPPAASADAEADPVDVNAVRTYGQLFEGLLRGWRLLPIGVYRRVHPATGLKTSAQTVAALQVSSCGCRCVGERGCLCPAYVAAIGFSSPFTPSAQLAAGPPSQSPALTHNRALLSYVYTNPPPATFIGGCHSDL